MPRIFSLPWKLFFLVSAAAAVHALFGTHTLPPEEILGLVPFAFTMGGGIGATAFGIISLFKRPAEDAAVVFYSLVGVVSLRLTVIFLSGWLVWWVISLGQGG